MKGKRHETDDPARMLSQRLNGAFRRAGEADWLDVRRRAGQSDAPARWSRRRVLLVAAVIVLAVDACAGSTGVIPWLNRKPTAVFPPLASPCKARSLRARIEIQGGTGLLVGSIKLKNIGTRACSLLGRPRVAFVGAAARYVRVSVRPGSPPVNYGEPFTLVPYLPVPGLLRALPPGKTARVFIYWSAWCSPGSRPDGTPGAAPDGLALTLRSGDRIVLPLKGTPSCYGPSPRASLSVTPFTPMYSSMRLSSLPLRAAIVGKRLFKGKFSRSFRLQRGTVFRYVVSLTNTSRRSFRFHDCPSYYEELDSWSFTYVLNCRSVGPIAPGRTVRFAMELHVPKDASLGTGELSWKLDPYTINGPSATTLG